jgi:hypothetical protein
VASEDTPSSAKQLKVKTFQHTLNQQTSPSDIKQFMTKNPLNLNRKSFYNDDYYSGQVS